MTKKIEGAQLAVRIMRLCKNVNEEEVATKIVEHVCQWVETAGTLSGKRGARTLTFSPTILNKETGEQEAVYRRIVEDVVTIMRRER